VADRQLSSCNPLLVQKEYFQAQRTLTKEGRPALLSLLPFQGVDFYGNYSFRDLRQKRLHFWSYSHHPFYLQRGALSIKHDLQTRPRTLAATQIVYQYSTRFGRSNSAIDFTEEE
jgi:hypothetical protein